MKAESRILGIDDGPFDRFNDKQALIVGVIYRGGKSLDGVMSTRVEIDGFDATPRIIEMINRSKWKSQIRCIMLDGAAFAGFNVINALKLSSATGIPVIIVTRQQPDFKKIRDALENLGMKDKVNLLEQLPKPRKVRGIFIQNIGISLAEAEYLLKISCTCSLLPEPVRAAHIIASGIVTGESKGCA